MARKTRARKGVGGCSNGGDSIRRSMSVICKGHIMKRDGHVLGCIHALAGLTHRHAKKHKCSGSAAFTKLRALVLFSISVGQTCKGMNAVENLYRQQLQCLA